MEPHDRGWYSGPVGWIDSKGDGDFFVALRSALVKDEKAHKYDELSFKDVIDKELKIMDMTAFTLCKENNLPIAVLSIKDKSSLLDFINNKKVGTIVR